MILKRFKEVATVNPLRDDSPLEDTFYIGTWYVFLGKQHRSFYELCPLPPKHQLFDQERLAFPISTSEQSYIFIQQ